MGKVSGNTEKNFKSRDDKKTRTFKENNINFERESVGKDLKIQLQFSILQLVRLQSVKYRQIFHQV